LDVAQRSRDVNRGERTKRARYMEWAKTRSAARFNLATSGIVSVPMAEFPLDPAALEVTVPGAYGYPPLLERIARHEGVGADCVVTAAGTSMANHLAFAAVLEAGDEVVIEQPTYGPLIELAEYFGARVRWLPRRFEDAFAVNVAKLERAITRDTRLVVLTNLHNPSSALLGAETLRAIGEAAQRVGARVLVDEAYREVVFDGSAPSALCIGEQLGGENPFIVTNSLTKAYGLSGLRCGWILAAPELARRMWLLNDLFAANNAHPAERMSVMAFDHLDRFRARTHALLAANRPLLDSFLDSRADLESFRPAHGTVVFPRLRRGEPKALFALLREKHETSVVPGEFFEMPQHFRIGISGNTDELRSGLERLGAALDEIA
jgi:aspartate/methionine/tyrosine aminotransferase